MSKTEEIVFRLAEPYAAEIDCEVLEVEYKKEGADYFLRVYLDRESGVDMDACAYVSERLSAALDEADPIREAYFLEVCSPGIDRALKRDKDFVRFAGKKVDVKLYAAKDGIKEFCGVLVGKDGDVITVQIDKQSICFTADEAAYVKLAIEF
ncbi:MAG: ribosome maturation factor RimP [Clostridia bacterium]|nr:ribosome maturation factor RimP [Clostridia bacterium]